MGMRAGVNMPGKERKATVEWFDARKGYGFIQCAETSESIFVHQTAIQMDNFRKLHEGQECTFELGSDDSDRPKAMNVVPGDIPPRRSRNARRKDSKKEDAE